MTSYEEEAEKLYGSPAGTSPCQKDVALSHGYGGTPNRTILKGPGLVGPTFCALGNCIKEARNIEQVLGCKASLHVKISLASLTWVWNLLH
jgi:hypothetical protein